MQAIWKIFELTPIRVFNDLTNLEVTHIVRIEWDKEFENEEEAMSHLDLYLTASPKTNQSSEIVKIYKQK